MVDDQGGLVADEPADISPKIETVAQLLQQVSAPGTAPRWFRGQVDSRWRLEPSLKRERGWVTGEYAMVKRFRQIAAARLVDRPKDNGSSNLRGK